MMSKKSHKQKAAIRDVVRERGFIGILEREKERERQ
jgi:hypothetical protein